jgi:hypothetical protein
MSLGDFLKDLPIHNSENFSKLNTIDGFASGRSTVTSRHRPAVYVPTTDFPSEQVASFLCSKWID